MRFLLRTDSVAHAHCSGLMLYGMLRARDLVPSDATQKRIRSRPFRKRSTLIETNLSIDVTDPITAAQVTRTHLAEGWRLVHERAWLWIREQCGPRHLLHLDWAHVELIDSSALITR